MNYCSLSASGRLAPYLPRLSLDFLPGLNVIDAPDEAVADTVFEAFRLLFQGDGSNNASSSATEPNNQTLSHTCTVEAVIELVEGQRVRLTRRLMADGTWNFAAFDLETKACATEQWHAAAYGVLPCLSGTELSTLTALTSEQRGLTPEVLTQLRTMPTGNRLTLHREHIIVLLTAGLALGALIWPASHLIAAVAGTMLAITIWLFFRRYIVQNAELVYRRQLLHFGVTHIAHLEERIVRRQWLERRYEAERQDVLLEKDGIPPVLRPFAVASPLCVTGNDRLPLLFRDPTPGCTVDEAMKRASAVMHIAQRRQCIVLSLPGGFATVVRGARISETHLHHLTV